MMYSIGIDPGKKGGIVILDNKQHVIHKHIMPVLGKTKKEYDVKAIFDILGPYAGVATCYLERAQPQGNNGPKQAFTTGYGYGVLQGVLTALEIPFHIVAPRTWQKKVFEGLNSDDTKLASALFCKRKWPEENWVATERSVKIHDGLTDGACIAYYGAKHL